jgi:hypothetical protein
MPTCDRKTFGSYRSHKSTYPRICWRVVTAVLGELVRLLALTVYQ